MWKSFATHRKALRAGSFIETGFVGMYVTFESGVFIGLVGTLSVSLQIKYFFGNTVDVFFSRDWYTRSLFNKIVLL